MVLFLVAPTIFVRDEYYAMDYVRYMGFYYGGVAPTGAQRCEPDLECTITPTGFGVYVVRCTVLYAVMLYVICCTLYAVCRFRLVDRTSRVFERGLFLRGSLDPLTQREA